MAIEIINEINELEGRIDGMFGVGARYCQTEEHEQELWRAIDNVEDRISALVEQLKAVIKNIFED